MSCSTATERWIPWLRESKCVHGPLVALCLVNFAIFCDANGSGFQVSPYNHDGTDPKYGGVSCANYRISPHKLHVWTRAPDQAQVTTDKLARCNSRELA